MWKSVALSTFPPEEAGGRHRLISISMCLNNGGGERGGGLGGRTDWAVRSHLALCERKRGKKVLSQKL